MSDLLDKQLKLHMALLVAVYWMAAFVVPFAIVSGTEVPWEIWLLFGALFGYFGYTAYRAWRRGWKSRFILRAVIPLVLFVSGCVTTWLA